MLTILFICDQIPPCCSCIPPVPQSNWAAFDSCIDKCIEEALCNPKTSYQTSQRNNISLETIERPHHNGRRLKDIVLNSMDELICYLNKTRISRMRTADENKLAQSNLTTNHARKPVNLGSKQSPGRLRAASQQAACASALNEEGKALFAQGQHDGAAARFERAIALLAEACPSHSVPRPSAQALQRSCRLNLASCRLAQGRLEDARACCDTVLSLDPSSCKALFRRAAALAGMARRIRAGAGAGAGAAEKLLGLAMQVCE